MTAVASMKKAPDMTDAPYDLIHRVFATFDAHDVPALAEFITDDIHLRIGKADTSRAERCSRLPSTRS